MNASIDISPEEWDIIETWLDQKGVVGEASLPDKKLHQIHDLEEKIEHIKKVREEMEDSIRQSKIKEFHKHVPSEERDSEIKSIGIKKIKFKTAFWYAAAAVAVVIFGIFWLMETKSHSEKIFTKNFKPDVGLPLKMSTVNVSGFYEGMLDYKQENYKEAIEKWEVLVEAKPENDTLNYFLGVTNLALGNASKSLQYLENQERFRQSIFKDDALYYTALAKIKEGKFKEAKVILENNPSIRNSRLLNDLNER